MIRNAPDFFHAAPGIVVHDPLAGFLGACDDGLIEYRYADAVALAGHSCPTVAAAFLMARAALQALYPTDPPERGAVRVEWRDDREAGVTGVMATVVSLVTGAADGSGFKGIGTRFERRGLLTFNASVDGEARFTRLDSGAAVDVSPHLDKVPMAPEIRMLMRRCLSGDATASERNDFKRLWQARVRSLLLDYCDDRSVIETSVTRSAA